MRVARERTIEGALQIAARGNANHARRRRERAVDGRRLRGGRLDRRQSPTRPDWAKPLNVELPIVSDPDPVAVAVLAVIVAVPASLPVTRPVLETVAVVVLELVQVTVPMVTGLPDASTSRATACVV